MRRAAITLALALVSAALTAQAPDAKTSAVARPQSVTYLFPEQVTIPADKPATVDLHFKVANGLHVNSHKPHSEELIPTALKFPDADGVKLVSATYPEGADYTFASNPGEKLSVYSGEFVVHAQLTAAKGDHLVQATLRYQACNNEACFPPRNIPVAIDVIAQ